MATSRSFRAFGRRMKIRAKQIEKGTGRKVRRAAIAFDQGVVLATPVDTGRARSNWLVSIGSPLFANIPSATPGARPFRKEGDPGAAAAQAIGQGVGVISRWKPGAGPIFIVNSVPYIGELERGKSRQAPAGMIAQGLIAARAAVRGIQVFRQRVG